MNELSETPAIVVAPRVTFQGEAGAYGEDAVSQRWGNDATPLPSRTFTEALARVARGDADCAVIPVWNSALGDIHLPLSALADEADRLVIVDELLVPVRHCLLALPGTRLKSVLHVGSHPVAIRQCSRFFTEHADMVAHAAYDTGGAARELAGHADHLVASPRSDSRPWYGMLPEATVGQLAVIASARAAERHGLRLLLADIQDDPANATRFVEVRAREMGRW